MTAVRRFLSLAAARAHGLGLRRVLVFNLVMQVVIIFTGGVVRLSGSGLGCPTWPECVPGSYTPTVTQAQGWHKYIEFGNRLLTYVLVAAVVLAAFAVWHEVKLRALGGTPRDRRLVGLGLVPLLGVPAQAVIGGVSVLTDLNPWVVSLHFLCSALLVAVSTWLLLRAVPSRLEAADAAAAPVRAELRWLVRAVGVVAALVVVLGTVVTGSGPHSGDADVSHRFAFDVRDVSWLHADAVWLFVGLVCALILALRLTDAPQAAQRRSLELLGVTLTQGLIGYVQYFTGVPAVLVGAHMIGAALLVAAVTAAAHAVLTVGAPAERGLHLEVG